MSGLKSGAVLITGATGYIGSHVAKLLLDDGFQLRVAARGVAKSPKVQQFKDTFAGHAGRFDFVEADLLDESLDWRELVRGCSSVVHVASSFPEGVPRNEEEAGVILRTAVDGTKAVVSAVAKEKSVKKLVITSSVASIAGLAGTKGRVYTESDWMDADSLPLTMTYEKSKTLAERAAWEIYESLPDAHFSLVCINPAVVLGPVLLGSSTSLGVVRMLFRRELPLLPQMSLPCVDVRDVAAMHVAALKTSAADGRRVVGFAGTWTMQEVAQTLQRQFGHLGYRFPQTTAPDFLFRFVGCFSSQAAPIVNTLGKESVYDNNRMRELLGIQPLPLEKTLEDTGHSLISIGQVPKTAEYEQQQQQQQH